MEVVAGDRTYLLDNQQEEAGLRFEALSRLFDEATFRRATALGLGPGWRVWEVGAGGPSVPSGFARMVDPAGSVLATDIDPSWLETRAVGFDVRRHDVGSDEPPGDGFDLVHARLVLVHVTNREGAIASMVSALRPGGWLFLEEADPALQPLACPDERGPAERLANRLRDGFRTLMAQRGVDLALGRTLPRRLRELGLEDVRAEAFFPLGGPVSATLERATVAQIGDRLVGAGLATPQELKQHLANVASGDLVLTTAPMIAASGRKPISLPATAGSRPPQPL